MKELILWGEIDRGATVPLNIPMVRVTNEAIGVMIVTQDNGTRTVKPVYPDFSFGPDEPPFKKG